MRSYRLARRSFLQGIGAGAVGLRAMLRTMEAGAQGMGSPPRLLITHWPVGTIHYFWKPTGSGTNYTTSQILSPFEGSPGVDGGPAVPSLRGDMIVLYGMTTEPMDNSAWNIPGGGGHEAGTMKMMCGTGSPGTRSEPVKVNDAVAGGPSWDQIFLKNVPALQTPGTGYANAICDARVDTQETSTRCLSYDHATDSIPSAVPGGNITQHIPLLPTLSPFNLYNQLFGGMTGGTMSNADMIRLLKARKSVLDHSLSKLTALQRLAPASEGTKIMAHADAIRAVETQLSALLAMGADGGSVSSSCQFTPMIPDSMLVQTGTNGDKPNMQDYLPNAPTMHTVNDAPQHAAIGAAHWGVLRAAFQCDIIRVATFQWSPGTNHVSFAGLYPNIAATSSIMHHPTSHVITNSQESVASLPAAGLHQDVANFLANVHNWYNQQYAVLINTFKTATDVYGGNLLANTVIPQVTEIAETTHTWHLMPALIFGGSALGMKGGQYVDLSGGTAATRSLNSMWISIAQAFFKTNNPLSNLSAETFIKAGLAPIPGLWG